MSHYRIKKDGIEFPVAGLSALERLVMDGGLAEAERVFDPTADAWRSAGDVEALKESFNRRRQLRDRRNGRNPDPAPTGFPSPRRVEKADPPRADTGRESTDPPDLPDDSVQVAGPETLEHAIPSNWPHLPDDAFEDYGAPEWEEPITEPGIHAHPAARPKRPRASGQRRNTPIQAPFDTAPQAEDRPPDKPPRALGETDISDLIQFSSRKPTDAISAAMASPVRSAADEVSLLDPTPFLETAAENERQRLRRRTRSIRQLVVAAMAVLLGLGMWTMARSYVTTTAYPPVRNEGRSIQDRNKPGPKSPIANPTPTRVATPDTPAPATVAPQATPEEMAAYEDMEDEIRDRMLSGIIEVIGDDGLESGLMVELSRLGIQASLIKAPILERGGPGDLDPVRAEVRIWYPSHEGELDRELASIGLVVGKYIQHYEMTLDAFEINIETEGQTKVRSIDPQAARRFYLQQSTLVQYLMARGPS